MPAAPPVMNKTYDRAHFDKRNHRTPRCTASRASRDSRECAVTRCGLSRKVGGATFDQLAELRFDLVACSDMLHPVVARA